MKQLLATTLLLAVVGVVGCGEAKKPAAKPAAPAADAAKPADPAAKPVDPAKAP